MPIRTHTCVLIEDSTVFKNTFSCVSVRFSPLSCSTLLVSFLCPTALPAFLRLLVVLLSSHHQVLLVLQEEEREVRLQEGCPLSSTSAPVVLGQLA